MEGEGQCQSASPTLATETSQPGDKAMAPQRGRLLMAQTPQAWESVLQGQLFGCPVKWCDLGFAKIDHSNLMHPNSPLIM